MPLNYGKDYNYAASRLIGSIVTCEKEPVVVENLNTNSGKTIVSHLSTRFVEQKNLEELDLSPVLLGNVNFGSSCKYLMRFPMRRYRQGLTSNTVPGISSRNLYGSNLSNAIKGIYPNIERCVEDLFNDEAKDRAFCRRFKVSVDKTRNYNLVYKNKEKVGIINSDNLLPQLSSSYQYLQENLEDSINGVKS